MAKLAIVIGSTRPGRVGLPVAEWFVERARAHGGFEEVELVGLRMTPVVEAVNIPFVHQFLAQGRLQPNDVLEQAAPAMLDELVRVEAALRVLRAPVEA